MKSTFLIYDASQTYCSIDCGKEAPVTGLYIWAIILLVRSVTIDTCHKITLHFNLHQYSSEFLLDLNLQSISSHSSDPVLELDSQRSKFSWSFSPFICSRYEFLYDLRDCCIKVCDVNLRLAEGYFKKSYQKAQNNLTLTLRTFCSIFQIASFLLFWLIKIFPRIYTFSISLQISAF